MLLELKKQGIGTTSFFYPDRKLVLHSMISSCGFEEKREGDVYYWDGMKRGNAAFFLWQLTLAGRGMLRNEDNEYIQNPGDAMFLRIPHNHCYWLPEDSASWQFVYFCLYGRENVRILQQLHNHTGCVMKYSGDSPFFKTVVDICAMAARGEIASPFDNSIKAYKFTMELVKDRMPAYAEKSKPEFIRDVEVFCRNHLGEDLRVDDLATASGYSRYHFSRLFTKYQGVSPAFFLRNLRLQEAANMLQGKRLTIKETAAACGFMDCSHFCRLFRDAYGVSPETFRSSGMY